MSPSLELEAHPDGRGVAIPLCAIGEARYVKIRETTSTF